MGARAVSRVETAIARAVARLAVVPDDLILIALSGGADSVALLHAMRAHAGRHGYRIAAAHLNHGLRGAESDRDEQFVRQLCARLGVELTCAQAALDRRMPNLEERAREIRYDFLNRIAGNLGARYVALAHHAGDQAETVMIRLMRGAGAAGLAAMSSSGPGCLIRPMLSLSREEIIAYLNAIDAEFVSDSSNLSLAMLRNRVRHELLPMIERSYARGFSRRLIELAGEMRAFDDLLNELAQGELSRMSEADASLDITALAALHQSLARAVLRLFVRRRTGSLRRVGRAHLEALYRLCMGDRPAARLALPGGWKAVRRYRRLAIVRESPIVPQPYAVPIATEGRTMVVEAGFAFEAATTAADAAAIPANSWQALFDAERLAEGFLVRSFEQGDRIAPLGMSGSRKVKDVFIDRKLAQPRRSAYPLVTVAGQVAWIPGLLRGRVALLDDGTRKVLQLSAFAIER